MTKEVEAVIVPTVSIPRAAAPVAPMSRRVRRTRELAVTLVVDMVAVPPTRVTEPIEFAPAAVVVPTLE